GPRPRRRRAPSRRRSRRVHRSRAGRRSPDRPPGRWRRDDLYCRNCDQHPPLVTSRKPALGCLIEIVETLVLTLIIFWVIQSFVAQPFKVQQVSMERTLEPEQYVLVDKLTPRFDPYKRGDIVVFDPPESWPDSGSGQPYIKRVIGIGGDTIELRDGLVYVNG